MDISFNMYVGQQKFHDFGAQVGDNSKNLTIKDGKIVTLDWSGEDGMGAVASPNLEITHERFCMATIDFIRMHNPQDFYQMKDELAEGKMKEHCLDVLA